jgi:hypothetical protein
MPNAPYLNRYQQLKQISIFHNEININLEAWKTLYQMMNLKIGLNP